MEKTADVSKNVARHRCENNYVGSSKDYNYRYGLSCNCLMIYFFYPN